MIDVEVVGQQQRVPREVVCVADHGETRCASGSCTRGFSTRSAVRVAGWGAAMDGM